MGGSSTTRKRELDTHEIDDAWNDCTKCSFIHKTCTTSIHTVFEIHPKKVSFIFPNKEKNK